MEKSMFFFKQKQKISLLNILLWLSIGLEMGAKGLLKDHI